MAEFRSLRRYYLSLGRAAREVGDEAIADVWKARQQREPPGILLPEGFPARSKLALAGYTATEDLVGTDECELVADAHLSAREARAVLAAIAAM